MLLTHYVYLHYFRGRKNYLLNYLQRTLAFSIFRGMVIGSPLESVKEVAEGITRVAVRELTDDGVPGTL